MRKKTLYRSLLLFLLLVFALTKGNYLFAQKGNKLKGSKALIYTKNGKGYIHDNISSAVASIKELVEGMLNVPEPSFVHNLRPQLL